MFDRIAPTYDLLNRLLSFRRDIAWRRRLVAALPSGDRLRVLDLATGTGDVLLALAESPNRLARGIGLDMSAQMLMQAKPKLRRAQSASRLSLNRGDACAVGFAEQSFDAVTIAFGIRNVPDVPAALREMYRVLRPGGRALILEFSLPRNLLIRAGYLTYFRHILPAIGRLVSGDAHAYRYLNASVENFPYGDAFVSLMRDAGFASVRVEALTFGVATLYIGER